MTMFTVNAFHSLKIDYTYKQNSIVICHYYYYLGVPKVTTLMEVQVPITNTEQCKKAYTNEPAAVIDDRVLCAGYPEGGKDSCRVIDLFDFI